MYDIKLNHRLIFKQAQTRQAPYQLTVTAEIAILTYVKVAKKPSDYRLFSLLRQ